VLEYLVRIDDVKVLVGEFQVINVAT